MKTPSTRLRTAAVLTGLLDVGCTVEMIDAFIAEHGVTECSSSGDGTHGTTTTTETGGTTGTLGEDSAEASTSGTDGSSTASSDSTSTATDTSSTTDTTGPSATCGNGVIEGDESCDDGNDIPDDGCQDCAKDSLVFISSEAYGGSELGGLWGADQRCRNLASKAGLPRPLTFKAWLSTAAMSAKSRLLHSPGRYVLVNGLVVAHDWEALTSGTLENPIMVDEMSITRENAVWTGTLSNGESEPVSEFCGDWDDDSGFRKSAGFGISSSIDGTWSFFDQSGCFGEGRIYCIEQ